MRQNGRKQRNPAAAPEFPGELPGPFQFPSSRAISRDSGFPGKSVAPDSGSPWELIAIKSGISARRRRSGGPNPNVVTRLEAIPASPLVGAGVSGPRERLAPTGAGIPRITPVAFLELERPDF